MANPKAHRIFIPASGYAPNTVTGEVVTIPAGAAGTVRDFYISKKPISDSNGSYIGGPGNSSIAIAVGVTFDTEVEYGKKDADMANGEYWIDYITGRGRGKRADNVGSMTVNYTIFI